MMRAFARCVVPALLMSVLAACPAPQEKPLQGAVLILLDTVRADHLSSYGYARPTSPNLERLAASGVRFQQTVSCAPWTRPSVAAILMGRYPSAVWGEQVLVSDSLVDRIRASGYRTAGFTEGGYVSRKWSMDQGFETYAEEKGAIIAPQPTGGIANTFRQAQDWLRTHKSERFFLFIHTYEPHAPYTNHDFATGMDPGRIGEKFSIELLPDLQAGRLTLTPEETAYVRALYDGDLLNTDRFVGAFLGFLHEIGLDERTLIAVASDHGEEMGEHFPTNIGDHGHSLYDDLLLVPLIIHRPGHEYAVRRVRSQVRTIDVMPTILDLLGVAPDPKLDGTSLVPLMNGTEVADRDAMSGWPHKGELRASLRARGFKYVTTVGVEGIRYPVLHPAPPHELFDLAADPGETKNLAEARPELAREMHDTLMQRRDQVLGRESGQPPVVAPEIDERLKSLGYVH